MRHTNDEPKNRRDYTWQRIIVIQTIQTKTQTTALLTETHRARTEIPIRTAIILIQMLPTAETAAEIPMPMTSLTAISRSAMKGPALNTETAGK